MIFEGQPSGGDTMPNDERELVKVVFSLDPSEVHEHQSEFMWAASVGPDRYRLQKSPSYAYGYSQFDIVEASLIENGTRVVRKLVAPSGHSTYRIIIAQRRTSTASFDEFWESLARLGCRYEMVDERYLVVDVPPEADIDLAYELLESGESSGAWYFEEAHCGHPTG